MDKQILGKNIRKYRVLKGLTQEQLAEKTGLDTKHITRLENGWHMPNTATLNKIITALNINYSDIGLDFESEQTEINENPIYIKCLAILNSAKDNKTLENFYEALKLAQKMTKGK